MNTLIEIVKLVIASVLVGLGLLLATVPMQLSFITPVTGWLTALLGVFMASSRSRGMRLLGFGVIAVGFYAGLRSADIIRFPFVRVGAGIGLVALGVLIIYQVYLASKQS